MAENQQPSQAWLNNECFASGPSGKSRGVAALLALFLGGFGVQYFYLNKPIPGIVFLVLWIAGWFTCFLPWFPVGIFCLVQAIMMFVMDNQTFNRKFVDTDNTFPMF